MRKKSEAKRNREYHNDVVRLASFEGKKNQTCFTFDSVLQSKTYDALARAEVASDTNRIVPGDGDVSQCYPTELGKADSAAQVSPLVRVDTEDRPTLKVVGVGGIAETSAY